MHPQELGLHHGQRQRLGQKRHLVLTVGHCPLQQCQLNLVELARGHSTGNQRRVLVEAQHVRYRLVGHAHWVPYQRPVIGIYFSKFFFHNRGDTRDRNRYHRLHCSCFGRTFRCQDLGDPGTVRFIDRHSRTS
uniref:(northern house mosquito) hypothetical protein n=1 Tax=Culex pipiens TaxID=7175 RepID=A0A8D7ZXI9_CULPI